MSWAFKDEESSDHQEFTTIYIGPLVRAPGSWAEAGTYLETAGDKRQVPHPPLKLQVWVHHCGCDCSGGLPVPGQWVEGWSDAISPDEGGLDRRSSPSNSKSYGMCPMPSVHLIANILQSRSLLSPGASTTTMKDSSLSFSWLLLMQTAGSSGLTLLEMVTQL